MSYFYLTKSFRLSFVKYVYLFFIGSEYPFLNNKVLPTSRQYSFLEFFQRFLYFSSKFLIHLNCNFICDIKQEPKLKCYMNVG